MTAVQARTVLGLSEHYTETDLKSQYRKKVLISHPDRNHGDDSRFIIVQKAFEILTNLSTTKPNYQQQQTKDVYQARRNAEEQYKEKVKYYYRQKKKSKKQIEEEMISDFKESIRYFTFVVLFLITFALALIIAICFGAIGVFSLIIILVVLNQRYDFSKFKL